MRAVKSPRDRAPCKPRSKLPERPGACRLEATCPVSTARVTGGCHRVATCPLSAVVPRQSHKRTLQRQPEQPTPTWLTPTYSSYAKRITCTSVRKLFAAVAPTSRCRSMPKNRERQCCALPSTHLVNGVDLMGLSVDDEPIVAEVTQRVLLRRVKPKTQAADGAAPSAAGGVAAALFGAAFL